MKGRKPRPTNLKILEGEPNKDRINLNEPQPLTLEVNCPKHLKGEARAEWRRIYPELKAMGLISLIDRAALAVYCQAWERWVKYSKIVEEKGELYKTQSGNVITSPALWVANKAAEQMHKFLTEFGMTPASRSRLTASAPSSDDPLDKLLNTRKN